MPVPLANFDGLSNRNGALPPDTNGDIGFDPNTGIRYYFQWVNLSYQVWDVSNPALPVSVLGPFNGNQLWAGFGGPCEGTNWGDPIVLFDSLAGRWFASQFSINGPYYQCIAVSQTGDPTGAWHRYAYLYDLVKLNDYPKFGVWPDGYYMTANQFRLSGNTWIWAGQGAVVFERDKMLAGLPARMVKFDLFGVNENYGSLLPSDLDGLLLPPDGAPNPFIAWDDGDWYGGQDAYRVWNFHIDWNDLSKTTFGVDGNPNFIIPSAEVTPAIEMDAFGNANLNIVPQPGTSQRLDSLSDRLMYRSQYRNFGSHQSLVSNHTVYAGGNQAGIHWFELRLEPDGWQVYQQGVYGPDEHWRWMASAAQDGSGNLAIGYNLSSATQYPQIRYTGRLAADPVGLLTQNEVTVIASTSSQTGYSRWGDYSSMSVDPLDDCTFWYTQQYTGGGDKWRTRIASFRYPSCAATEFGYLTGIVTGQANGEPLAGVSVRTGGFETVSGADGRYRLALSPGDHEVTYQLAGFLPATGAAQISVDTETSLDIALDLARQVTVRGTVKDAAGHAGLPIYARVDFSSHPGSPVFTDPLTGSFQTTLSEMTSYQMVVTAVSGGYMPAVLDLTTPADEPDATGLVLDVLLEPDTRACDLAPGYEITTGFLESFTDGAAPAGWLVLDMNNSGRIWQFNNPAGVTNKTGGSGAFAGITDTLELGKSINTSLISPMLDFSADTSVMLSFRSHLDNFDYRMIAGVDVSSDGGATWERVWEKRSPDTGPKPYGIDISAQAAAKPNVRIRFYATSPGSFFEHTWQVDDVQVNDAPQCVAQPGALLVGTVSDETTGQPLVGATLTAGAIKAVSVATPFDPALPDGFYQLWVPKDTNKVQVTLDGYVPVGQPVSLPDDSAVWQTFTLKAAGLDFSTDHVDITVQEGTTQSISLALLNSGGSSAPFNLITSSNLPFTHQPDGPFAENTRLMSPKRTHEMDASHLYNTKQPSAAYWPGVSLLRSFDSGDDRAWGLAPLPDGSLWIGATNRLELAHYSPDSRISGESTSQLPWVGLFGADLAYQPLTGRLWQVNVGGDTCIVELNAASGEHTGQKICPDLGVSQRALAFDPLSSTFFSGSWIDGILYHYNAAGQLLDSVSTGLNLAGLAYQPVSKHLYALVSAQDGADVYVLDAANGYTVLGGFTIPGMTHFAQSGLEFSADGHLWALDGKTGQVFELAVGEPRADAWSSISWLSVRPTSGEVPAGGSQDLTISVNAAGLVAGSYQAYLLVTPDTPNAASPLAIHVTVLPKHEIYIPLIKRNP